MSVPDGETQRWMEDLIGDVGGQAANPADPLAELLNESEDERRYVMRRLVEKDPIGAVKAVFPDYTLAESIAFGEEYRRQLRRRNATRALDEDERRQHGAEPPPIVNLSKFLDEPDEPTRYRVEGLWPNEGRVVLAAQNKSGKTTLTGNLIRSLVDGDDFLGRFPVEPVQRLILADNESSPSMIRRWLREQGIRNPQAVDLMVLRGGLSSFNILDPAIRADWAQRIGRADVLVFDCLRPALDALGLSEDKDAGRFLEALDELTTAASIPETLLVHHMGHSNERSRGDSRLEDWPDAKWKIVKEDANDPDSARYFSAFGRDVDQPERRLAFDSETRHLSVCGGSRQQATTSRIEDMVLLYVAANPGCGMNDIRDQVEGDNETKRRIVRSLIAADQIRMIKVGQKHTHYLTGDVPDGKKS